MIEKKTGPALTICVHTSKTIHESSGVPCSRFGKTGATAEVRAMQSNRHDCQGVRAGYIVAPPNYVFETEKQCSSAVNLIHQELEQWRRFDVVDFNQPRPNHPKVYSLLPDEIHKMIKEILDKQNFTYSIS